MKITAILPTYQSEKYLLSTLQSIQAQSSPISQLVVSDDGSQDSTRTIVKQFSTQSDFEVLFVDGPCNGITANYLSALSHATGELIVVTDHDDVWTENRIETIMAAFKDPAVALVCHDSELVDHELNKLGRTIRGNYVDSLKLSNKINTADDVTNYQIFLRGGLPLLAHSLAFRATHIETILGKPSNIDDWWFEEWVSCVCTRLGRLHFVPQSLILYRQHTAQTSGGFKSKQPKQPSTKSKNSKYQNRISKLTYCLNEVGNSEGADPRAELLNNYLAFLERRDGFSESQFSLSTVCQILLLALKGSYTRYAQGLKSVAADLVAVIRRGVN